MIATDVVQQKIDALPEPVLDYLYSERAGELNLQIIDRHQLNEAQEASYFAILREVFVKELPLDRLISEIKERLGLDDAKSKALAIDIAGYRLLPLDKWLGDVVSYLRANGADVKIYPEFRVVIAHRTIDQAAEEVAASVTPADEPHLQNRLQNIVESFLAGVRTESQTVDVLTRPEKIGGAGLDKKAAEYVLEEVREETRAVVLDQVAPDDAKKKEEKLLEEKPGKKDDALDIRPEDALELAQFKKSVGPSDIEATVRELYLASGLKTDDEAFEKRVKTIIGNRLRDVRDQMETLEIMTQPKELGGLSLGQDAARALLGAIQARLTSSEGAQKAKIQKEKSKWVEAGLQQQARVEVQTGIDQKDELEKLYQSIVTKSKKATANAPVAAPAPRAVVESAKAVAAPAPTNLPIAASSPVPPEFRPPAPPPTPVPAEIPRPQAAPPITLVKPTPQSIAAVKIPAPVSTAFAQRPKLEDVKASPKLTGPVEELRALTIVDFRRLSKDPKEACVKVKDKIDLLTEQSYTRRNEGIAAWTASEVVRTYLELMHESLNGTPLAEAVTAREAQKKPALTPDEFRAISELSRQLRY